MLITISRQFAAGGSVVAKRIADALGWRVVDNELIDQVAARAGVPAAAVARLEERAPTFVERLARVTALELPDLVLSAGTEPVLSEAHLVRITRNLVKELATEGKCVLVGRASSAVLARREETIHVRLVAPLPYRIAVAAKRQGISSEEAARLVEERDNNRARYHREYYDRDWNDPVYFDIVLNTERLGVDGAAELVLARARSLGWTADKGDPHDEREATGESDDS